MPGKGFTPRRNPETRGSSSRQGTRLSFDGTRPHDQHQEPRAKQPSNPHPARKRALLFSPEAAKHTWDQVQQRAYEKAKKTLDYVRSKTSPSDLWEQKGQAMKLEDIKRNNPIIEDHYNQSYKYLTAIFNSANRPSEIRWKKWIDRWYDLQDQLLKASSYTDANRQQKEFNVIAGYYQNFREKLERFMLNKNITIPVPPQIRDLPESSSAPQQHEDPSRHDRPYPHIAGSVSRMTNQGYEAGTSQGDTIQETPGQRVQRYINECNYYIRTLNERSIPVDPNLQQKWTDFTTAHANKRGQFDNNFASYAQQIRNDIRTIADQHRIPRHQPGRSQLTQELPPRSATLPTDHQREPDPTAPRRQTAPAGYGDVQNYQTDRGNNPGQQLDQTALSRHQGPAQEVEGQQVEALETEIKNHINIINECLSQIPQTEAFFTVYKQYNDTFRDLEGEYISPGADLQRVSSKFVKYRQNLESFDL